MPYFNLPLKLTLIGCTLLTLQSTATAIANKGELLLSNHYEGTLTRHENVEIKDGWQRRISYGEWTAQQDGSVIAVNVPEHGHGPVMTFIAPIRDIIIECEFKLPKKEGPDRHFRIFLDHADYRGHTIQTTANVSSTFRPAGLSLQHLKKSKDGGTLKDIEFGLEDLALRGDTWYKMKLEIFRDRVRTSVNGVTIEGHHSALDVEKSKIGLNPGKAGGSIRNFRAWAAVANDQ